jgi:hypothetical protein
VACVLAPAASAQADYSATSDDFAIQVFNTPEGEVVQSSIHQVSIGEVLTAARLPNAQVEGEAPIFAPLDSCWGWRTWQRTFGYGSLTRRTVTNTFWCAANGVLTYRVTGTTGQAGSDCRTWGADSYRTGGGVGFSWVTARGYAYFDCHFLNYYEVVWLDIAFNAWGGTDEYNSGLSRIPR